MDNDPILRLYIPQHLRDVVIRQYHDWNGHMGIDNVKNVKVDLMVNVKMATLSAKFVLKNA